MALLAFGYALPSSAYLSPRSGLGYVLGIAGGSMMLLLLIYPAASDCRNCVTSGRRASGSARTWFSACSAPR